MSTCADMAGVDARGASWSGVVRALCAHRADTPTRLAAHLEAFPTDVAAWCLKGFAHLTIGRADERAGAAAAAAVARAAHRGECAREERLLAALAAWLDDRPQAAVAAFDAILADEPCDLLALKLQHGLLLMLGQPQAMRASLERVLPAWRTAAPETGFVLGCYAFSLEETGAFDLAEAVGRRAVAMQPDDAWAIHAVTHVFESLGRAHEGLEWLDTHADGYAACNVFRGHVHWHRALLHFHLEEFQEALDVYDAHVATPWTGDYRDMSNAVSLLWRLESEGVHVGKRWHRLAELAGRHVGDQGSAFALAHYAVALGRADENGRLAQAVAEVSTAPVVRLEGQEAVVRDVAVPLCRGILAWSAGDAAGAFRAWFGVVGALPRIGGSNAQRELFTLMLIEVALASGHFTTAQRIVSELRTLRPGDPWLARRAAGLRC